MGKFDPNWMKRKAVIVIIEENLNLIFFENFRFQIQQNKYSLGNEVIIF